MPSEYELQELIEEQARLKVMVVKMTAEGRRPTEITKETGLSLREQRQINEEFKKQARSSEWVAQRSKEIIGYADVHFMSIIDRLNEVEEEAKLNGENKLRADVLAKLIVAEGKRVEFLQKAGIINDQGIGEELAEREAREAMLVDILKRASERYPEATEWIYQQMRAAEGMTPSERVREIDG